MPPIGAVIVDFDGTVCRYDVGVRLLERFGDPAARGRVAEVDRAFEAGEIGLRDLTLAEVATLHGSDRFGLHVRSTTFVGRSAASRAQAGAFPDGAARRSPRAPDP